MSKSKLKFQFQILLPISLLLSNLNSFEFSMNSLTLILNSSGLELLNFLYADGGAIKENKYSYI
jgi:hypothetical protein